jgi:hypothetical protein
MSGGVDAGSCPLNIRAVQDASGRLLRGEGDGVAELFETVDVVALDPRRVERVEAVRCNARIGVGGNAMALTG